MPLCSSQAGAGPAELARQVRAYIYQPQFFADVPLGPGLPADPSILNSYLWYVRMEESTRALGGMDGLRQMARCWAIPGLDFSGHKTLVSADVEALLQFDPGTSHSSLKLLRLAGTQVDDRAMPAIGRQFGLEVLGLGSRVSDRGLTFLKNLKRLRSLTLEGPLVTDAALDSVALWPRLERLSIQDTGIGNAGLLKIAELRLRQLDLGHRVDDHGLSGLSTMKTLEQLDLHAASVTAEGLSALSTLPAIHTLFLGPSVRDVDVAVLPHFKQLVRLDLSAARLTDASLPALSQMKPLEELAVNDTALTEKALAVLGQLPRLRYLDISRTAITAANLQQLFGFSALEVLSFTSAKRLTPEDIRSLGRLPKLHTLVINGHPLGRELLAVLQREQLRRSRLLEWLVPEAEAASDADLAKALQVASVPEEAEGRPLRGLRQIHAVESSLDEVISAPPTLREDNQEYDDKNFMGEFVIEGNTVKKKS